MKKVLLGIAFISFPLTATKELATPVTQADCENAMRLCAVCCAATSAFGCGMYVGGIMADSSFFTADAVINTGAGLWCCGFLGTLIGSSCPLGKEHDRVVQKAVERYQSIPIGNDNPTLLPNAVIMSYNSLPQEERLEELP